MAKKEYLKIRGRAVFPHLHAPDTKFDAEGVFKTDIAVDAAAAEPIMAALKQAYKDYAKQEKLKLRKEGLPWEQNDDGEIVFKTKMKHRVTPRDGEPFTQTPLIFDAKNVKLEPGLKIGSGSELVVAVLPVGYKGFGGGISLRLAAVQVIDLVTWGASADTFGFDAEDGGYSAGGDEGNPFDEDEESGDNEFGEDEEDGEGEYSAEDF